MVQTKTVISAVFFLTVLALVIEFFSPPQQKTSSAIMQSFVSSATSETTSHPTETFTAPPSAKTINDAFKKAGKEFYPEDEITAVPDPSLGLGSLITVKRAMPITLTDGKKKFVIRTWASDLAGLLNESQIKLGDEDKINPSPITTLKPNLKVTITRVARSHVTEIDTIEYKTIVENNFYEYVGTEKVVTAGKNGEIEKRYLIIRIDGEIASKTLVSSKVIKPSVTKKVIRGALKRVTARCQKYVDWAVDASLKNGINPNDLLYRMFKESSCTPTSVAAAGYQGLLQYDPSLWVSLSAKAGYPGASIWDAKAQIYTTAWAWANGHRRRWPIP
ncbi:G5 domain-containing protein [Candidatus Berkelbacteria bacterium]|nr:G5 domain-containing protein [Candidatus Berkelbacteria bacterium]